MQNDVGVYGLLAFAVFTDELKIAMSSLVSAFRSTNRAAGSVSDRSINSSQ
jgi:hypothetical protein